MPEMTTDEYKGFLTRGTRTAKLATVRKDGRPHVVPIWFVLDGDDLIFTTARTSVKGQAILRDGRVSLCVDDKEPPYAFVLVEGTATATEDSEDLLRWATRIAARYVGEEQAEAFGKRNAVEGELLVRATPTKVVTESDVAGW
jgi:PPOX class probable F420-dependent enzyme